MNLSDLTKSGAIGGLAQVLASNPQVLAAAASLLSSRDASVGGSGGLAGLVQAFQGNGLGDEVSSWIGTGPNQPVSADRVAQALGPETLSQFATKAGINSADAGSVLAGLLPNVINQLTPQGQVPDGDGLEGALGSLLSSFRG
jgi:uncharacterized protein YidB (DUF937 family)